MCVCERRALRAWDALGVTRGGLHVCVCVCVWVGPAALSSAACPPPPPPPPPLSREPTRRRVEQTRTDAGKATQWKELLIEGGISWSPAATFIGRFSGPPDNPTTLITIL